MKKFSKILVTLGVTLFLLSFGMKIVAEAQPPTECDSDPCYQSQSWTSHTQTYTFGLQPDCSDCWVEIHYRTRNNSTNPNCQSLPPVEYQLEYIIISGACYYSPCSHFTPFDMKAAYQEAMASLLNQLGYPPVYPNNCGPVFSDFTVINCFRQDFDLEGNKILRTCATYTCCKQDLQLCYKNGNLEISSISTASTGDCSNDPHYPDECMTICNWIDDAIVPKRVLEDNNINEINPLTVFPNPISQNSFTFEFNIDIPIEKISILTNDGKLIKLEKNELTKGNIISTEGLSNGNYMLIVKGTNGRNYYSQFVINR